MFPILQRATAVEPLCRHMKQKKSGKKLLNWHRPLGPSQLRQRFLVHRYDDPDIVERGQDFDWSVDADACDAFWDAYDPYYDPFYEAFEVGSDDINMYVMEKYLAQILNPPMPFFLPEWVSYGTVDGKPEAVSSVGMHRLTTRVAIEERLADYLRKVTHFSDHSSYLQSCMREAMGDWQDLEIVKRVEASVQSPDLAHSVCLFAPFWVRSPKTWDQNGSAAAFLDHIFTLYEVPRFLYSQWFRELNVARFKWLCWFIMLGQGGSLKRAGELFQWNIPNRFQFHLQNAPADATPIEACIYAEVKRLGGCGIDFARVIRNLALVIDPTESSAKASHSGFWHETVRWLINHRDAITDEQSDLILSWAMHKYTEAERAHAQPFSWKGRSVGATLERSVAYRRQVKRVWSGYKWNSHGWDWTMDQAPIGTWSFIELTSGEDLFLEGQAMHHCVTGYAARCASGYSAIFSVRLDDSRRITVEINPRTTQLVQARGASNRKAQAEEQSAIRQWMKAVVKPEKKNQES